MTPRQAFIQGYYKRCSEALPGQKTAEGGFWQSSYNAMLAGVGKLGDKAIGIGEWTLVGAPIAAGAIVGYLASKATSPDADAEVTQKMIVDRALSNQVAEMKRKRAFRLLSEKQDQAAAAGGTDTDGRQVRQLRV